MVWNDIIQYLAALRQRKSRASTTMPPYLWEGGRTLPRSHLLHFILQLLEIFLAMDVSWALSPYIDDLEANSWGWAAGGWLFLCKLYNVNFLSVSVLILFFILVLENKINPFDIFTRNITCATALPAINRQLTKRHYLLPPLSSANLIRLFSDISCRKLNFNAPSSLLQITAIQTQCIHFPLNAHSNAVLPQRVLYILLHILK